MQGEFEKKYNPLEFEEEIYKSWLFRGCFEAKNDSEKEPFVIVMPPPNVTGQLHMGHALDETLQDILIRFKKMSGFNALWVPGVDHSAIATEVKVVEMLKKEGLTKEKLGRTGFLKRAFEWKQEYENRIVNQLKKLGVSCDWNRMRFTMDEMCSDAVLEFFVNLYNEGLIYRGERMINWCCCCKTSISDIEVEYKEKSGNFYHIKYFFKGEDNFLEIATTRPETLLADVAVAVNHADERYKKYVGKTLILPISKKEIPVIEDQYVDLEFGTGAVKITPGHDFNDFEVGKRHNLEIINMFNEDGSLNSFAGEFAGLKKEEARKKIVERLKEEGLLLKIEPISHNVGHCYRCGEVVEPTLSLQWFVKMESLKRPAIDVVKNKEIEFIPKRFEKTYFNWMENVKDWCISRQIWWGHQIPAYYCEDCGHINVSKKKPNLCEKCGGAKLKQDEDTLDTWFSSALWPFATLGWPKKESKDYKMFYPTSTLVTGYDIIFFWVARMIFSALYNTKKVPFKKVLIHGLVRDEQGRKMSKSLGNGVDPLEVIKLYGADALRFTLANGINAGSDMRYGEKKVVASRNFANKLWNASRFIFMQKQELGLDYEENFLKDLNFKDFSIEDKWIIFKLNELIIEVTKNIEGFEISVATAKLYGFVWDIFCDWYIELFKIKKAGSSSKEELQKDLNLVYYILATILKLLHPFMPFITQKIYFKLFGEDRIILDESWPTSILEFSFEKQALEFEKIIEVVRVVRNFKAEKNIANKVKVKILISTEFVEIFKRCLDFVEKLGGCEVKDVRVSFDQEEFSNCTKVVTSSAIVYLLLDGLVDEKKEREKLLKEKEFLENEILIFEKKLSNENFLKKAPMDIVEKEKEKLKEKKNRLEKVMFSLG